jgi:hypothetical protein
LKFLASYFENPLQNFRFYLGLWSAYEPGPSRKEDLGSGGKPLLNREKGE